MYNNRYSLFVGRYQPFHEGHRWLIQQRLDLGKKVCIAIMDIHDLERPKQINKVPLGLEEIEILA